MKYSEMIKLKEKQMSKAYNVLIGTKFPTIRSGNVVEDGKKPLHQQLDLAMFQGIVKVVK